MTTRHASAGATPVAESAMLSQSYPFGPQWARYRVPFPGMNGVVDPRAVGIVFEGEGGAPAAGGEGGATPPAAGSGTAGSGEGGNPAGGEPAPATGDEPLGEPGKRALQVERDARKAAEDRAKAAEKERDEAKLANASDQDKAVAAARAEGEAKVTDRLHSTVRRTAVREALLAAGVSVGLVADLSKADEFAALKVGDDDEVNADDLSKAVKAHKARVPDAYKAPAGEAGSADGGAQGGGMPRAKTLDEALDRHYAQGTPARG